MNTRFVRLQDRQRPPLNFSVDGVPVQGQEGDTVMVAMLAAGPVLRQSEFADASRAGFCLMGACQDCWVWCEDGSRLRACSTLLSEGMRVLTKQPGDEWTNR